MAGQSLIDTSASQSLTASGDDIQAVKAYINLHHQDRSKISWHLSLNNHASTRPQTHGGPLVHALTDCKTFEPVEPGPASRWRCSLQVPNSFAPGDGLRVFTTGEGITQTDASEDACQTALAVLLLRDASKVILRPKHWKVPIQDIVQYMATHSGVQHQALPVHQQRRHEHAGEEGDRMSAEQLNNEVADIIRWCLHTHDGSFDPSRICHRALGLTPAHERMHQRLNNLLHENDLRPFIQGHPEFQWHTHGQRGMLISWANAPGSASAPENTAASAQDSASACAPDNRAASASGSANAAAASSVSVVAQMTAKHNKHNKIHYGIASAPANTAASAQDSASACAPDDRADSASGSANATATRAVHVVAQTANTVASAQHTASAPAADDRQARSVRGV